MNHFLLEIEGNPFTVTEVDEVAEHPVILEVVVKVKEVLSEMETPEGLWFDEE